ncbi:MAG TPA: hypothetical protein VEB22_12005 [Phycisphaerales bacterium]|nr:hypothetical protein [Phycisphaerales bacterium]
MPRPLTLLLCLFACIWGVTGGGCAVSRHDQVREASREVQGVLDDQLKAALAAEPPARQARVERLTSIKYQLSAANVALGAVPHVLRMPAERETAYTFLEEVYSTLSWNARLPVEAAARPLPVNPLPGKLHFADPPPGR